MRFLNNALYLLSARMENIMLYEQLVSAERLTMLGQMAAAVAHEIRNPLTGLDSFVQMINANQANKEKITERFFEIAPDEFKRLEKLTDNLLALSHNTRLKPAAVELNSLLDEVNEFLAHIYRKNKIEISKNFGEIPVIQADKEQIRQVILNLSLNAVQSARDGGEVKFTTGVRERAGKEFVFLSVQDNGSGIDAAIAGRIFDPFFTTKAEGTGLGLAICKNIMDAHKGLIEVESRQDKGSTFTIYIPARE
jgi:signal transduction histidine kinase